MKKKILKGITLILLVLFIGIGIWINASYPPSNKAFEFGMTSQVVNIIDDKNVIRFEPLENLKDSGIIFYPGGKVEPEAYNPLAYALAEKGYLTTIIKMPFNLAVMNVDAGKSVIIENPNIKHWYIGGHSLGGAMAGNFVYDYPNLIKGVFFLGAYPVKDLRNLGIDVLMINGTLDGIINKGRLANADALIPANSKRIILIGANHSQFGSYGLQKKDNKANISWQEQQTTTVDSIIELIENKH